MLASFWLIHYIFNDNIVPQYLASKTIQTRCYNKVNSLRILEQTLTTHYTKNTSWSMLTRLTKLLHVRNSSSSFTSIKSTGEKSKACGWSEIWFCSSWNVLPEFEWLSECKVRKSEPRLINPAVSRVLLHLTSSVSFLRLSPPTGAPVVPTTSHTFRPLKNECHVFPCCTICYLT